MTARFAAAVAAVLLVAGCGAATYNEGDTTDDTTVNECADVDTAPENCEP